MKLALILLVIGLVMVLLLSKIQIKKQVLTQIGIIVGVLLFVYGLILVIQPNDYVKYTKTTISKDTNSSNTK